MQTINPSLISNKKVLLRLDLDVPVEKVTGDRLQVTEDFRLKAGIPTLKLCVENASKVIVIGHLGRPSDIDPAFSLRPVYEWFQQNGFPQMTFESDSNLQMLENLRFDHGEENLDMDFARKLASMADIFVFEAFASHRPAVSTTVLPSLLPHAAGLQFIREIRVIGGIREKPKKPFVAIMGGAKVADKLPVIQVLAQKADAVLVGGKIASEILRNTQKARESENPELRNSGYSGTPSHSESFRNNVFVGKLTEDGFDITPETVESWRPLIVGAAQIIWNGPVGKVQSSKFKIQNLGSERGSYEISKLILESQAETVIGGGDTIAFLNRVGLLKDFEGKGFVSTGGGAMLKLLSDGTLPTMEVLNE